MCTYVYICIYIYLFIYLKFIYYMYVYAYITRVQIHTKPRIQAHLRRHAEPVAISARRRDGPPRFGLIPGPSV